MEKPTDLSYFWADFHGQSEETVGSNSIEDYFSYARDYSKLDIAAHQGNDFQITDEHHQLLGSQITELETLSHLQWELLPFIATLFDNIMTYNADRDTKGFYIKKVITPLSLEFKIDFLENIYRNVLNYNYDSIETIIRTISVSDLLSSGNAKFC